MKKIIIHKPGDYKQLRIEECADPSINENEVLIKVAYAGVNYADVCVRWGIYQSAKDFVGWPITPGFEVSGIVIKTGSAVTKFKTGDLVFGVTRFGGYATQIALPEKMVFKLPVNLTLEQAAGFPAVYLTAYHALFQNIIIRKGAKVLIHSCAGGVGSALLKLCRISGFETVGVVGSSHKVEFAKQMNADFVIDKSTQDLWSEARRLVPEGYDVVLDANGAETLKQSFEHLASSGKLICYGFHTMLPKKGGRLNWPKLIWTYLKTPRFNPLTMTNQNKSLITFNLSYLFDKEDMFLEAISHMTQLIEEGKLSGPSVTLFDFDEVGKAHKALESGQTTGKIVLKIPAHFS